MKNKTLLLHNTAINYRLELFENLKSNLGSNLDIWIFNEKNREYKNARYFKFFNLLGKFRFSFSAIIHLIFERGHANYILWGSHSYELIFFFIIAKIKGRKIVFWTETWDWGKFTRKDAFFFSIIKFIAKRSDLTLYPGKKVKELYESLNINDKKILPALDASSNFNEIDPAFIKNTVNPDPGKWTVLFMGRAMERKGLHYLLEAFQLLPANEFELVAAVGNGEESYVEKCKALIKNHLNIRFMDFVPKDKVNSFFASGDVYVYPSISPDSNPMGEPWGLSINEAVNVAIPVIATDVVAAAYDLIEEGTNGFIIKQKNAQAIADAILKSKKLDKNEINEIAKTKKEEYSYRKMAEGFVKAIQILETSK
jgi:glycosyltransferase involved in cell wall biosynthesis